MASGESFLQQGIDKLNKSQRENINISKAAGEVQNQLAQKSEQLTSVLAAQQISLKGNAANIQDVVAAYKALQLGPAGAKGDFISRLNATLGKGNFSKARREIAATVFAIKQLRKNLDETAEARGVGFEVRIEELKELKKITAQTITELVKRRKAISENAGVAAKTFQASLDRQIAALNAENKELDRNITYLKSQKVASLKAADASKALRAEHDRLNERIAIAIGKLLRYRIAFFLIRGAMNEVKDAIKEFIDIQNSFAQLQKVLRPVVDSIDALKQNAFGFAQTYARDVKEVIDVFTKWSQTGLQVNEVLKATQATLIAANAVNLDATEIVDALTSAIFAYGKTASETTAIVNKWMAVQAEFPVTAKDLLKALQTIGVVAKDFRVGIDELNGVIAGVGSVTRKTGKEIAQSFKTILARLPREETIQAFQDVGVAVLDAKGRFRPFLDIVSDLSDKWADLSEAQRKNIALTAGGIRRYVDFTALVDNFATVQGAVATSLESSGRALYAAGIQLNTFQASLNKSKAILSEVRQAIGQELVKPLQFFLDIFNALGNGLTLVGGALIKLIAGFTAFVGILAIGITAAKAYSFVQVYLGKSLLGANEKLIKRFGIMKVGIATVNRLTAAEIRLANAQKVQLSATKAQFLGLKALTKGWSIWLLAIDAAIVALSLLAFKQKEYQGVADETVVTIEEQARAIFSNVAALVTRQERLNKAAEDRKEALQALISLEKQVGKEGIDEQRAAQEQKLLDANRVLEQERVLTAQELAEIQNKSYKDQLKAQASIATGAKAQINIFDDRIAQEDKLFQGLKAANQAILGEIESLIKVRDQVQGLQKETDQLFVKPNTVLDDLSNKMDGFTIASEDAYRVLTKFLGEDPRTLIGLGAVILQAGDAVSSLEEDYKKLAATLDKGVPAPLRKEFLQSLQNARLNAEAQLQSIQKDYELFQKDLAKGVDTDKSNKDLVALATRIRTLFNGIKNIPRETLGRGLTAVTEDIGRLEKEAQILSFKDARTGAKELGLLSDRIEGVILAFEEFDFSAKFLKQFDAIVRGVADAATNIREQLAFEGIEEDAKRTAQALQSFYLQQFKALQNLNLSLEGELEATRDSLARAQSEDRRARAVATGTEQKLNEEIRQIQAKIQRIEFERLKIAQESIGLRKTLTNLVKEELTIMAKLSKEEAAREIRIKDTEDFFASQAKLAELTGKRQEDVLRIERERLKAMARMRVDQILQTKDTETQARLVEELGGLMIDLRKNAREITLEKLEKQAAQILSFVNDIKGAIAAAVSSIPDVIVAGIDKRRELTDDIKEAEIALAEAVASGNEQAVLEAKLRLKELQKELDATRKFVYELKKVGETLIVGLGQSINKFLSERFAQEVIELQFKGSTLGDQIARSLANVNKQYIKDIEGVLARNEMAQMRVFEEFVANLGQAFSVSEGNFQSLISGEQQVLSSFLLGLDASFEKGARLISEAISDQPLVVQGADDLAKNVPNIKEAIESADLNLADPAVMRRLDQFKKDFGAELGAASEKYQIDPRVIAALVAAESSVNQFATSKPNKNQTRDYGFGQINEKTADSLGVSSKELYDAAINLDLTAKILRDSFDTTKDFRLGIAGYNYGPGRAKAEGFEEVPDSTKKHNARVLAYLAAQLKQDNVQIGTLDQLETTMAKEAYENRSNLSRVSSELRKEYGLVGDSISANTAGPIVESLGPLSGVYSENKTHTNQFQRMIDLMAQESSGGIDIPRATDITQPQNLDYIAADISNAIATYSEKEQAEIRTAAQSWGEALDGSMSPLVVLGEAQKAAIMENNQNMMARLYSIEDEITMGRLGYEKVAGEWIVALDTSVEGQTTKLKDVLNAGFGVLINAIGAAIGAKVGGGSAAAAAGGQIGALAGMAFGSKFGSLGGPIGSAIGAIAGGVIGGLFGGKKEAKEFVPSIQANTDALTQNTLAIQQLEKNVINAPSNFNIPGFPTGAQSPALQIGSIVVNGSGDANQVANLVINRIRREYERGTRTGTTRRVGL